MHMYIHTICTDKCVNQCVCVCVCVYGSPPTVSGMSVTWIIIWELEWCLVKQWAVRQRDKLHTHVVIPEETQDM